MAFSRLPTTPEPTPEAIEAMRGPAVLEFGTTWCGHCIAAQSPLETAFDAHADVHHLKIEDGRGKPLGRSFRVKLWPTLIFLRDGEEVARLVRPTSFGPIAEARTILEARGVNLVVICPPMAEMHGLPDATPDSFVKLYAKGELPAWLKPVSAPADVLKIYAVMPQ